MQISSFKSNPAIKQWQQNKSYPHNNYDTSKKNLRYNWVTTFSMHSLKLDQISEKVILKESLRHLKSGGMIIFPTETAYGLGVDATNHQALEKLLKYKGSRTSPTSIAVASLKMAEKFANLTPLAKKLYQKYLPGPLTVISTAKQTTDPILTAGTNTIGIRIPDYPFILKLIKLLDSPITSTSANTSGGETPYSLQDYLKTTDEEKTKSIDLFLDAGILTKKPPSTVVKAIDNLEIVRRGEITPNLQ